MVVVDHITSASALVLPLERIVARVPFRRRSGADRRRAHGPGHVDLDRPVIDGGRPGTPAIATNGCAHPEGLRVSLQTAPAWQLATHPTTPFSHGYGKGYLEEFDWTGTRDPSAFLAIGAAISDTFTRSLAAHRLRQRNIDLAAEAAALLSRRLNTRNRLTAAAARCGWFTAADRAGERSADRPARGWLLPGECRCPRACLRSAEASGSALSVFAYNEPEDYARLADIVARVAREV